MAKRPCATPGCPTIGVTTYCVDCARTKDKARGTRQQRGYDRDYDKARDTEARRIARGERVTCTNPRCLYPNQPVTLGVGPLSLHYGHNPDRTLRGPEHARCNLSEAGKASHGIS